MPHQLPALIRVLLSLSLIERDVIVYCVVHARHHRRHHHCVQIVRLPQNALVLLDGGYASVCIRRSIKQISVEDVLCTEVVDAIVGIVMTICAHIVAELANLVESFRGNLRVSIHTEE